MKSGVAVVMVAVMIVGSVAAKLVAPPTPIITSYTATEKSYHNGTIYGYEKAYVDFSTPVAPSTIRVDDYLTKNTSLMKPETWVMFNDAVCSTGCANGYECQNPTEKCGLSLLTVFMFLNESVYNGTCNGGNLWVYTTTYNYSVVFCISSDDVPSWVEIILRGESYYFYYTEWSAGRPPASELVIPSYCPCITENVAITQSVPANHSPKTSMQTLLRKFGSMEGLEDNL